MEYMDKESFEKWIADASDCYDFEEIDEDVESLWPCKKKSRIKKPTNEMIKAWSDPSVKELCCNDFSILDWFYSSELLEFADFSHT